MHHIYKVHYEKCIDTKSDINIALLQIRLTLLGPGLPSLAMLLFNHPIISRPLINSNNDDDQYEALVSKKT